MNDEKQKRFLMKVAFYVVIIALLFIAFKYIVPEFLPFIFAFIIAWALRKPSAWIAAKLRLPCKFVSILLLLLFYAAFLTLLGIAGAQVFSAIRTGAPKLSQLFDDALLPKISLLLDTLKQRVAQVDPIYVSGIDEIFQQFILSLKSITSAVSGAFLQTVSNMAAGLPSFFLKLLIMVISSFFITSDYERIAHFIRRHVPTKTLSMMQRICQKVKNSLSIYMRAYGILLVITFAELLIGLCILKIPYALAIAAAIAMFDLLPVVGTGGILIPWAIVAICTKMYSKAIGIVVLYLIIAVIRNSLELRLIGNRIGLHPVITLMPPDGSISHHDTPAWLSSRIRGSPSRGGSIWRPSVASAGGRRKDTDFSTPVTPGAIGAHGAKCAVVYLPDRRLEGNDLFSFGR